VGIVVHHIVEGQKEVKFYGDVLLGLKRVKKNALYPLQINEERIKEQLAELICEGNYNENVVKARFKRLKCIRDIL
jgi:hypothetical protein